MTKLRQNIFSLVPGFSLIEILVVISITTLLCGILLPAINRAKIIALQTTCQSRLRQWGIAFQLYENENDGYYPHIDGRDRTSSNPQTYSEQADYYYGWVDVLPPLLGEKSWSDYAYGEHPGKNTIFQCPSAILAPDEEYKYRHGHRALWKPHDRREWPLQESVYLDRSRRYNRLLR